MTNMEEFLFRYTNPSQSVDTLLDSEAQWIIESNEKMIESLLKIVLSEKQGIALCGHCDDKIHWVDDEGSLNEGNFLSWFIFL